MKQLFINPESNKLRAGWRILAFIIIFAIINIVLMVGIRELLGSLKATGTLWFTILGVSATLAAYISRRFVDKESFVSLGLKLNKAAIKDFLYGIFNSALVMAGIYFTMLLTGLIEFKGLSWWTGHTGTEVHFSMTVLPIVLAVFWKLVVVAWWEELAFRGIIFQNMIKGIGLVWSIILSSLLFGLVHAGNPDATVLSTVIIMLVTPQLIYAYLKTGQLWLPIGLHLGWNFFQASIFGFASSGQSSPTLVMQNAVGPEWLSGGAFGAEGSILVIPFTIASVYLIHWWVRYSRVPGQKFFGFLVSKQDINGG